MNVRLYFTDGMPARAVLRIIWQMPSICFWRSGSVPSRIAGLSLRLISDELSGSGTMSSVRPNDSTRSRSAISASTDHAASIAGAGSRLQMWLTPKPASTRRIASESPCCVPAFMRAGCRVRGCLRRPCLTRARLDSCRDRALRQRADSRQPDELASIHRRSSGRLPFR